MHMCDKTAILLKSLCVMFIRALARSTPLHCMSGLLCTRARNPPVNRMLPHLSLFLTPSTHSLITLLSPLDAPGIALRGAARRRGGRGSGSAFCRSWHWFMFLKPVDSNKQQIVLVLYFFFFSRETEKLLNMIIGSVERCKKGIYSSASSQAPAHVHPDTSTSCGSVILFTFMY